MPKLCFTVDLDRDVNIPLPGHRGAGSIDRGQGTAPRFASTEKGLRLFSELLDDLSVKATFFAEGRTLEMLRNSAGYLSGHEVGCHGLEHEDFSLLSEDEILRVVTASKNLIKDISGTYPKSFRAPYMKLPETAYSLLNECGFKFDSSVYTDQGHVLPYSVHPGMVEIPVLRRCDASGIERSTYLWPIHEGNRTVHQFLNILENLPEGAVLVVCDHSWHIAESRKDGIRSEESVSQNLAFVREVLESLLDCGFDSCTVSASVPLDTRTREFLHAR